MAAFFIWGNQKHLYCSLDFLIFIFFLSFQTCGVTVNIYVQTTATTKQTQNDEERNIAKIFILVLTISMTIILFLNYFNNFYLFLIAMTLSITNSLSDINNTGVKQDFWKSKLFDVQNLQRIEKFSSGLIAEGDVQI